MVDVKCFLIIISVVCAFLSLVMLLAKDILTSALSLLGILLGTAMIYGLLGEHFIATVQLVVYAGAIMVLFIFSIMLLNLKGGTHREFSLVSPHFILGAASMFSVFGVGAYVLMGHQVVQKGEWTLEKVLAAGGNTKILSHALFTQYSIPFEAISVALLIAFVAAVTLAKRKFD